MPPSLARGGVRFGDHRLSATLDPRGNVRDAYLDEKPVGLVRTKR